MTKPLAVSILVEGTSDAPVVTRLLRDHEIEVHQSFGFKGKGYVDAKLEAYNEAAKFGAWLVVRDLDNDAPCAGELVKTLLPKPSKGMRLRIAVPTIEAWLLADAKGIARYFRVPPHSIPSNPEALTNAKRALVDVARRSRLRSIRDDMVPAANTTAAVGPGFVARVAEFADTDWSWKRAAARSDSLRRCVARIAEWT
jgi:hypothetical protein